MYHHIDAVYDNHYFTLGLRLISNNLFSRHHHNNPTNNWSETARVHVGQAVVCMVSVYVKKAANNVLMLGLIFTKHGQCRGQL